MAGSASRPWRERDLAYALICSRVLRPRPKLSTLAWWNDTTLGGDLGVAGASRNEVYAAMDWLLGRQDAIEATLASRHLSEGGLAMFDLSPQEIGRLHGPIGLDLGGKTPAEIAVAILAEVIAVRNGVKLVQKKEGSAMPAAASSD